MYKEISDVTVLTIIISTILLIVLGGIIIYFLFAYQTKNHKHQEELIILKETFNKTLLLSKLEIREQTLDHIAKELHANIAHLISVININLSSYLQNEIEPNQNIVDTKGLVKQLMSEIKLLSLTLNTEHIGKVGFQQMLVNELDRLKKTGLYTVHFEVVGNNYRLHVEKEIILFRLCQEILNNILKHAKANNIEVRLDYEEANLSITIADNGNGFDVEEKIKNAVRNNSTGIANVYNRSKQINGNVLMISSKEKGTIITVKIPT